MDYKWSLSRSRVSRVGGIGINEIAEDIIYRHNKAFDEINEIEEIFDNDESLYSKKNIIALQKAVRAGDYKLFKEYYSKYHMFI